MLPIKCRGVRSATGVDPSKREIELALELVSSSKLTDSGALTLEENGDVVETVWMTVKEVDGIEEVEAGDIEPESLNDIDELTDCWTLVEGDNVMELDIIGGTAEEFDACDSGSWMMVP